MINQIIGKRMKMLRKSLNLTQKQFAYYIPGRVDQTYIGKIERDLLNRSAQEIDGIIRAALEDSMETVNKTEGGD